MKQSQNMIYRIRVHGHWLWLSSWLHFVQVNGANVHNSDKFCHYFKRCLDTGLSSLHHFSLNFHFPLPSVPPPLPLLLHHLILTICVFQVNGKELTRLSGDPTLDIRDPILSNILRRGARRRAGLAGAPAGLVPVTMGMADCVDSCTQTDISFQHMLTLGKSSQHPCGAPPPPDPPPSPPLPPLLEPYLFNELWVGVQWLGLKSMPFCSHIWHLKLPPNFSWNTMSWIFSFLASWSLCTTTPLTTSISLSMRWTDRMSWNMRWEVVRLSDSGTEILPAALHLTSSNFSLVAAGGGVV